MMRKKVDFNIKSFTQKLANPDPLYLNRAEKEYVLKLMEDNQDYDTMLDLFDQRTYRKQYLKEERAKRKNLLYPDADEIYMRYFEQREYIELLKQKCLEKDSTICDLHKKIIELTPEA